MKPCADCGRPVNPQDAAAGCPLCERCLNGPTASQPATPGSDSVHAQIKREVLELDVSARTYPDVVAQALAPLVDRLRAEAKAEALEEAAKKIRGLADGPVPSINDAFDAVVILRARAAAYRTNPSSEGTQR